MVEGPGCAVYAERLRARVRRGQAVRSARGSAAPAGAALGSTTAVSGERISGHSFLTGCVYRGVETLGKELFMYFGQIALSWFGLPRFLLPPGSDTEMLDKPRWRVFREPHKAIGSFLLLDFSQLGNDCLVQEDNLAVKSVDRVWLLGVCSHILPYYRELLANEGNRASLGTLEFFTGNANLPANIASEMDQEVHFGMNGSMCINRDDSKDRNGAPPVLEIQLTEDTVCFFEATVEYRNAAESEQKVRMMESLDICSPKFSCSRAESEIKQQKTRMLCDVLLDQAVLPGVGNIIKNEALFDSGLHPAVKVCQLTDKQIHHLVKMTRDFALLFYKCRRTGSALYQHYKVYRRARCGQCHGNITACRLGENNRMTYLCSRCQTADAQLVNISKLPTRNSLIGWACGRRSCSNEHVAQKSEEEWTCMCCTLINKPSAKTCDACLTSRPEVPKTENDDDSATFNRSLMKYPCNDFGKPSIEIKMNRKAAFGHTTLVITDLSGKAVQRNDPQVSDGCPRSVLPKSNLDQIPNDARQPGGSTHEFCSANVTGATASCSQQAFSFKPLQKKQKTDHVPSVLQQNKGIGKPQVNVADGICALNTGHPRCSKHGRLCALRVVRKDGENKGRQFYTCPLPRKCRCDYFQWADLNFPFCNHGKRCVMKTVLKIGPNNGKNFFVCPSVKEKQCGFFQWAEQGPGIQIIP